MVYVITTISHQHYTCAVEGGSIFENMCGNNISVLVLAGAHKHSEAQRNITLTI